MDLDKNKHNLRSLQNCFGDYDCNHINGHIFYYCFCYLYILINDIIQYNLVTYQDHLPDTVGNGRCNEISRYSIE